MREVVHGGARWTLPVGLNVRPAFQLPHSPTLFHFALTPVKEKPPSFFPHKAKPKPPKKQTE